jgi:hypothetical protein
MTSFEEGVSYPRELPSSTASGSTARSQRPCR